MPEIWEEATDVLDWLHLDASGWTRLRLLHGVFGIATAGEQQWVRLEPHFAHAILRDAALWKLRQARPNMTAWDLADYWDMIGNDAAIIRAARAVMAEQGVRSA